MRTPLLPIDELLEWGRGLVGPKAINATGGLGPALEEDRARLRAALRAASDRPLFREALFVASPSLSSRLEDWVKAPTSDAGQRVEPSLVRYFSRTCGRCTPFGLFAGCSVGAVGSRNSLEVASSSAAHRHARLDVDFLSAVSQRIVRDPALRPHLVYRPNSSLYRAGDHIRLSASAARRGGGRSYNLIQIGFTDELAVALARARAGATPPELVRALVDHDPEIEADDAAGYVEELIESQVLVSELGPAVTGDAVESILAQLGHPEAAPYRAALEQVTANLRVLNSQPLGLAPSAYREVGAPLREIGMEPDVPNLLQVDLAKTSNGAELSAAVVEEIRRVAVAFHGLVSSRVRGQLDAFRHAFVARYEQRRIPLAEALDEEIGIGFGGVNEQEASTSPLLEGLPLAPRSREQHETFSERHAYLLRKIQDAMRAGADELVLGDDDLEHMAGDGSCRMPDAFQVTGTLLAASADALSRGEYRFEFGHYWGPSGMQILGRFCHADAALLEAVRSHLALEQAARPDAIIAEIVCLPEGRVGNVLLRPVLRPYEITFLGRSGAPLERQIPISDLYVSVENDRVVLFSKSLGREVFPRLSSAHNFGMRTLAVYAFLCSLQHQGTTMGVWEWGPLARARYLPRLRWKRCVLSPARWRLDEQLLSLSQAKGDERFRAAQRLRAELGLPRFIGVVGDEHVLPVDLDNVLSVEAFVALAVGRRELILRELFFGDDDICARAPEGRMLHEVVVPFVRSAPEEPRTVPRSEPKTVEVSVDRALQERTVRKFPPGSSWLYAKLYTGTATADRLLTALTPLVASLRRSGAIDRWFFIRYADPAFHVRVRFHGQPARLISEVLPALNASVQQFLDDGRVWKIQLDCYEREIERYGGFAAIDLAERVFEADSDAVLELLPSSESEDVRWKLTLRSVDALLTDFGLESAAKIAMTGALHTNMRNEFRADELIRRRLGAKFRSSRRELESLLLDPPAEIAIGLSAIRKRSECVRQVVAELATRMDQSSSSELAAHFVHMHINRMLRSAQRAQEMVLHDFLNRLYVSLEARSRPSK
jgi:thiopeptide-type bacteriocin biosynthesis protein